jgi:hypothetical protein
MLLLAASPKAANSCSRAPAARGPGRGAPRTSHREEARGRMLLARVQMGAARARLAPAPLALTKQDQQ